MDKYQVHIDELLDVLKVEGRDAFDERVLSDWTDARDLFRFASVNGYASRDSKGKAIGCLTMVRGGKACLAATPELTAAIRADDRLPSDEEHITPEHLPVMAEWQRRLDKELNR